MLGYVKGARNWHAVQQQASVRDLRAAGFPGEVNLPTSRELHWRSWTACDLALADLNLREHPTDDDPICGACTTAK